MKRADHGSFEEKKDTTDNLTFIFCTLFVISSIPQLLFMKKLHDFQPSQLLNLLTKETISYYKLVGDRASVEECTQCMNRIQQLRSELFKQ